MTVHSTGAAGSGTEMQALQVVCGEGRHWAMSLAVSIYGPVCVVSTGWWYISWRNSRDVEKTKSPQWHQHRAPISVSFSFPFSVSHMSPLLRKSLGKLMSCKSEVGDFLGGFCQPSKAGERTSQMARNTRLLDFFFFSFFFWWLAGRGFCKTEVLVHRRLRRAHSQWVGFGNDSVTMCFSADTFWQASGPLVTAFPLSTEGCWLTKPLPGLSHHCNLL